MTDLIPSLSIDAFIVRRDALVERVREASASMKEAIEIGASLRSHGLDWSLSLRVSSASRDLGWFGEDRFTDGLIEEIDRRLWATLVDKSGIKSFMDAEAREAFHKDLEKNAPPITHETVAATFANLHAQRGEMFERGVVNVFRKRSWNYKSNAPVAFGARLITRGCERLYSGGFHVSYGGAADVLDDLLRVMAVLEGHPEPDHRSGARAQISAQTWGPNDPVVVVGVLGLDKPLPLLEVKGHKNGNLHIRFLRPDLVERLNQIVAKHHPNVLPAAT